MSTVSARPNAGATAREPRDDRVEPVPQLEAQRRGPERVVDVVEAGERQLDPCRGAVGVQREGGGADPAQLDVAGHDGRLGAPLAAVRAVVAAEVREVDRVVRVGVPAAPAVLRVGGVLELRVGERVVLDAEVARAALPPEVGDERVVGVEHERRLARVRGDDVGPALGDDLELAVAVELVAEEVGEQQRARAQLADHGAEPELVDLEEPEAAVELAPAAPRGRRQRGRDPAGHVRARAVVHERLARALEDRRDHRGRRRLAVGRADHRAAVLQPRAEQADGVRLQAREDLPRERRAAAAPGGAHERADRLGGRDLRPEQRHGASTFSARGSTRIVTGRSAIGSPSA